MIQILPDNKRKSFGEQVLTGINESIPGIQNYLSRQEENKALKEKGIDVFGVNEPETRRQIIADDLAYGRKKKQAEASHKVSYADKLNNTTQPNLNEEIEPNRRELRQREREEDETYERKSLPKVYGEDLKEAPKRNEVKPSINQASLAPQPETKGKKHTLLDLDEITEKGIRIAQQLTAEGKITDQDEGIAIAQDQENKKALHNQYVEKDRQDREVHQIKMGEVAEKKILDVYPQATGELVSLFKKYAEEESEKNTSLADFELKIDKKATKFANDLVALEKSFPPPRLFSELEGGFYGNSRTANENKADIRHSIKPFLDLGLYDTVRKTLSGAGYAREEIESLITDLSENTVKELSKMPKFEKTSTGERSVNYHKNNMFGLNKHVNQEKEFSPETLEKIDTSIKDIFDKDKNTNLILLRKAVENKNVDWRTYKNIMNKMVLNGDIVLNPEQEKQFTKLNEPPLGPLMKLLHNFKLVGR